MIYLSYNTLPSHLPLFQLVSISQIRINDLKKKILKRNLKNTLALLVDPFPHSGNLAINKQPFSDFLHSNQYVRIILRKVYIYNTGKFKELHKKYVHNYNPNSSFNKLKKEWVEFKKKTN